MEKKQIAKVTNTKFKNQEMDFSNHWLDSDPRAEKDYNQEESKESTDAVVKFGISNGWIKNYQYKECMNSIDCKSMNKESILKN